MFGLKRLHVVSLHPSKISILLLSTWGCDVAIAAAKRVFLARFAGTSVFEPNGDRVGRIQDVVALLRTSNQPPRVVGIVVEVPPKRKIFIPITRVSSLDIGVVVINGQLNKIGRAHV